MADFEAIVTRFAGEDGNIPAASIPKLAQAIGGAVGKEFVDRKRYNDKLEELETIKGEKQTAEDSAAAAGRWEKKYADLKADFDAYKADVAGKEQLNTLKAAYRKLLEGEGIDAKRLDTIIRATQFDGMKLGEDGKFSNEAELIKTINSEWADFKTATRTEGAKVDTPPANAAPNGANSRAAELARQRHERMYGKAPEEKTGANDK